MTRHFERGRVLLQQNRIPEALGELKKSLAEDPENAFSYALMAECYIAQKQFAKAIEFSEKAVGFDPRFPFFFYVMARSNFYAQKIRKAKEAIAAGLRMNPADPDFYHLRASIAFYESNWQAALEDAETGLGFDSEHVHLINMRAQALIQLKRKDEASITLDYALNKAPENAYSHANKGWVSIEKDQYEEAVIHFKEALRLDPTNQFAKEGLKEAIKAKNFLYRIILKYFLWMNKMAEKSQWYFIIGIYVIYRIIIWIAESAPSIAGYLAPIILAYILFAFSSWIAKTVSNLFLRLHPLAKHVLDEDEKLGSTLVGLLGLATIICVSAFYIGGSSISFEDGNIGIYGDGVLLFHLAIYFGFMLIPIGGLFNSKPGTTARKNLTYYVLGLAGVGLIGAFTYAGWALNLFFIGILIYSFAANYIIMKSAKEFG